MQLIDAAGGLRVVIDGLRKHREISMQLDREYKGLLERHPEAWVAMAEAGTLAIGSSLEEVLTVVRTHDLDTTEFASAFLDPTQPSWFCDNRLVRCIR